MSVAKQITEGDILVASRLMRDIEDRIPAALETLKEIYCNTGNGYIIGITGAPGSGKSTLVDMMIDAFRKEGKSVGVVAVDPSSPFSGGAILGDRIRMQRHATDEGVFIRSLATRGYLGGLSRATYDIINVMDAMGKDAILVETVGVGQDEVDIVNTAHTSIVVLVPGMGDEIQAIKAGIIEIGDIFVINKCDREGIEKTEQDIRMALEIGGIREDGWVPPIFKTEAIAGKGITEVISGINRHKQVLQQGQGLEKKLRKKIKANFLKILENKIMSNITEKIENEGKWNKIIKDLFERHADPYTMAEQVLADEFKE